MKLNFTYHSILRIRERNISLKDIPITVFHPDKTEKEKDGKIKFIKLLKEEKKVLILICKIKNNSCKIITAFKSSKISKFI